MLWRGSREGDQLAIDEVTVLNGRYHLGPVIGRGAVSEVHDGHDLRLERPVAVKLLSAECLDDPRLRWQFDTAARAMAQFAHPHVVEVFDVGESDGRPYLAMERLPGESLAHQLLGGPLDQDHARQVAADLLDALTAAHAHGILHGNIKPSNVLFSADGRAKVGDFSMVSRGNGESPGHQGKPADAIITIDSVGYLAPERVRGVAVTPRSDLWSVGVVLYEALSGVKPFVGNSSRAVADAIVHNEPVPLESRRPELDDDLLDMVAQAMEKRPKERFASAPDMAAAMGFSLTGSFGPPGEDPAYGEAFETEYITEETPLVERLRSRARDGPVGRLMTAVEDRLGWRAPLLGGAAAVLGLLAIGAALIAQPVAGSGERPGTANTGDTVPGTTAPTTTPPTDSVDTSPATTAQATTSTTGRVPPTRVVAPRTPSSSPSPPPPPTTSSSTSPSTTSPSPGPTITLPLR